ncbi:hypothetical protein [Nocardia sp. NBC_01327]|uniref:hypothetical protein n=1 Tax=Nocardia sp. NBC_01327 TaxID=2903593 RepID=UPI002E10116A|nr:hypothetical protein OG326_18850 [Nocardia sp. NBC_01327]
MADEGVYRVRFSPLLPATADAEAFRGGLRALGGMVIYGTFPDPVVIGIAEDAIDRVGSLPFVESVESVTDAYAAEG